MFEFSSIEDFHARLKQDRTTCLQAVEHYLSRIEQFSHLNAFVRIYAEEALQRARELDERRKQGAAPGRLHGVVMGIKDVICYKDHPVTASSKALENFQSIYSATAIERLLGEEAIIIGHLNCDEFAMGSSNEHSFYGKVLNPRDELRVPGGSSGGSAAAQAAGLCMVALGSDTGGSVRQPADFCGVIGFKPTYGRISRHGLIAYASSFDQIGIFANNIPDVAQVLITMAGADEFDSTTIPEKLPVFKLADPGKKYRFAYFTAALDHPSLDPEIKTGIQGTIDKLKAKGHEVTPVDIALLDFVVPAYYILTTAEASSNLSRYDGIRFGYRSPEKTNELKVFYKKNRSAAFGMEVKRRIMLGTFVLSAGYYDAYYTKAQKVRKILKEKLNEIFNSNDVIILPNSPVTAFPFGDRITDPVTMYLADIYTVMANLAGIPAISLPIYTNNRGLPYGLQVMSNAGNELILLQVSNQLIAEEG